MYLSPLRLPRPAKELGWAPGGVLTVGRCLSWLWSLMAVSLFPFPIQDEACWNDWLIPWDGTVRRGGKSLEDHMLRA